MADAKEQESKLKQKQSTEDLKKLVGRTFAQRFRIDKLIGRGGMGAVYKAQQLSMNKDIALKVLARNLSEEPKQVQRFKQEANTSSKLKHPNTIRVIDFGQSEDGYLFLAMELLEGQELANILRREGALAVRRAAKIARQCCKSIGEAHQLGLVHRDLKPDNIFLCDFFGEKDFVKVLDFGIAKFMENADEQASLTQTGFIAGTPLYIAPEQALGRPVTPRTDLYSLGAILYEMLTGHPPFRAETPIAIVMRHIHDTPPPLQHYKPDLVVPPELNDLVYALLRKDPRQRPASAEDVGLLLEDLLNSVLVTGEMRRVRPTTNVNMAPVQSPMPGNLDVTQPTPLPTNYALESDPGLVIPGAAGAAPPVPFGLEEAPAPAAGTGEQPLPVLATGEQPAPASATGEQPTAAETGIHVADVPPAPTRSTRKGLMIAAAAALVVGAAGALILSITGGSGKETGAIAANAEVARVDPGVQAAKKKAEEDAAEKKAEEDAAKKKAEEDAAEKKAKEEAAKKKAEEEQQVAPVEIVVKSSPPGAEVLEDSRLLGNTPVKLTLTQQEPMRKIKLLLAGYKAREAVFDMATVGETGLSEFTLTLENDATVAAKPDPKAKKTKTKTSSTTGKKKKKKKKGFTW